MTMPLTICSRGHKFQKSRDQKVCPKCWPGYYRKGDTTKAKRNYKITSDVWLYPGMAGAWHFVSVSKAASDRIKKEFGNSRRGFGAVKVEVTVGKTKWKTSIFPDAKSGRYILPLKADVRKKEGIAKGDDLTFGIAIIG